MPSDRPTSSAAILPVPRGEQKSTRVAHFLDGAIFFFLALFAILLPHSIKGAQHSWQIAFLLWLIKLAVERRRPYPQPLSAPLLAYITLSGISTLLSPDPNLSWDRMKIVCLLLVGIVFAQNLQRLKQVRILVFLLILSGLAAAAFTAWQYTYGVGVRIAYIWPAIRCTRRTFVMTTSLAASTARRCTRPADLERLVDQSPPGHMLRIDYVRGFPFHARQTFVTREQNYAERLGHASGCSSPAAHPFKAQGTLGHYVDFAEMLMQIGCMTWAMLLSTRSAKKPVAAVVCLGLRRA